MELTYQNLLSRLVEAVPEFPLEADHVADNLVYLTFNDLTRFVNARLGVEENTELLAKIFHFIEEAARTGDVQVQEGKKGFAFVHSCTDIFVKHDLALSAKTRQRCK